MSQASKPRVSSRRLSRIKGVQVLYQHELTANDINEVINQFDDTTSEGETPEDFKRLCHDVDFLKEIVLGAYENQPSIDEEISAHLSEGWRLERLPIVVLSILRLAIYELRHQPLIPPAVVINEYIEVTKDFFGEAETSFVNGILDVIAKKTR
jgi:N utilization substance protein B